MIYITSTQIYKKMKKYPNIFQINDDFVTFNHKYCSEGSEVKYIINMITSNNTHFMLLRDEDSYNRVVTAYNNGELDTTPLFVMNKIGTEDSSIDVIYGDILWANMYDYEEIRLVFNWKDYIIVKEWN